MTSLSFPDVNVWLALASPEHSHHAFANDWWGQQIGPIGFLRFTQIGFLRLMTTAAAVDGRPLTMPQAWRAYDRLFDDDRVTFFQEPSGLEVAFRSATAAPTASPKMWADAYLVAFARNTNAALVTFDRVLASCDDCCVLLPTETREHDH